MTGTAADVIKTPTGVGRFPLYYGWVNLGVAALAMVATLPGRTQGLGLITEPLLRDFNLGRVEFAQINLWATLVGALFLLGVGRLVDRLGSRAVLTVTAAALGAVVLLMSGARGVVALCVLITLTRGLGQSSLSVVSPALVGQWFARRLSVAMGVYTVALSVGFMAAFPVVGEAVIRAGWRAAWAGVGACVLFGLAPLAWLLVRRGPESVGLRPDGRARPPAVGESKGQEINVVGAGVDEGAADAGHTLRGALRTSAFWVFALSSSVYGLVVSGISLFNESILAERGFDATVYHRTLVVTALVALVGNFVGGWTAARWSLGRLMGAAMVLLTLALAALPSVRTEAHVVAWAVAMGLVGGAVMVVFFTFWGRAFGRAHLGKIQGAAQAMTVLASATGPLLLARCVELTGSYASMFYALAAVVGALGVWAWLTKTPTPAGAPSRTLDVHA
ncbi:MAG TPA: MFS transporter [Pyrinomonadaceae bacterium]|nr:MFS transporter [Pyrinomonadaceae bacterium]